MSFNCNVPEARPDNNMGKTGGIKFYAVISFLLLTNLFYGQSPGNWETAVFCNDIWRYFTGLSEPPKGWDNPAFDDSSWPQGAGGFGFGDGDDNTIIQQCVSVYLRIRFNVPDTSEISMAVLHADYDDAFIAYLNGTEIARAGITGSYPPFNQTGADHESNMYRGGSPESFLIEKSLLRKALRQGENVLAFQVHNSSSASSDLSSNF